MFKIVYLPNGKDCLDIDGDVEVFDSHNEASKAIARRVLPSLIGNYSVVEIDGVIGVAINNSVVKLQNFIFDLQKARKEAFDEGNWDRVDIIGQCIDDAREELKNITK